MSLSYGHLDSSDFKDVVLRITQGSKRYNWLIVALDSIRGNELSGCQAVIMQSLRKHSGMIRFRSEGIWFDSLALLESISAGLIVPFSAAYIFSSDVWQCGTPCYTLTSESEKFISDVPHELVDDIRVLKALGYVADGDGVNFYFNDLGIGQDILRGEEM
jgi:hypothetical protein